MNFILKIIVAAVCATTVMTAFSYAISFIFKRNYKEPALLNRVLDQLQFFPFPAKRNSLVGWVLHYLIGLGLTILAVFIIYLTDWQFTRLYGIGYGFVAGIIGILSWKWMLKMHSYSPRIDVEGYFEQLLVAHILFGWSLAGFYNLL
ncbi:hypothetical protein G3O08_11990 [Cryomorpha ignava]|uniref:DUF2938 domain-containing protein n=1 Tax=Cryomorpha ignava TaxID=101383 RepID=A0A7K3WRC2_9FLAO|nr:hypothetical protein [Cryomorpha ignava]NEN24223.1 hypothetical protein [Cryomorpha ignava]